MCIINDRENNNNSDDVRVRVDIRLNNNLLFPRRMKNTAPFHFFWDVENTLQSAKQN